VLATGDPAVHRAASAVLKGDDSGAPEKRRRLG
jgi:inositol-phosphate phosphatase/L-galactose 1-phosphate phosphatase/histidinol-phosphatase